MAEHAVPRHFAPQARREVRDVRFPYSAFEPVWYNVDSRMGGGWMAAGNWSYSEQELIRMIRRWVPRDRVPKHVRIKDTADFFRVDYDDVVVLEDSPYFIRNNEREGR